MKGNESKDESGVKFTAKALAMAAIERLGRESPAALLASDPNLLRSFCFDFLPHHELVDAIAEAWGHADAATAEGVMATTLEKTFETTVMKAFVKAGGVQATADMMEKFKAHAGVCQACCGVFWNVAMDIRFRQILVENGAIPLIVNAMRTHAENAFLQERAAGSLWMTVNHFQEFSMEAVACGAPKIIFSSLQRFRTDARVSQQLIGAMAKMCSTERATEEVVSLGAIEEIIGVLKRFPLDVHLQCIGCWFIGVVSFESSSNSQRVLKLGGLEIMLDAIKTGDSSATEQACLALVNAALNTGPLRTTIVEAGTLEKLLRGLKDFTETPVQEACMRVIAILCGEHTGRHKMVQIGGISTLITAATRDPASATIVEFVFQGVCNLALSWDLHASIIEAGALKMIVDGIRRHMSNLRVCEMGCRAITNLLSTESLHSRFFSEDLLAATREAMDKWPASKRIQQAVEALSRTENPGAKVARERGVCIFVHTPRCRIKCPASEGCFCSSCFVVAPIFACVTCDGQSNRRYCSFCFNDHHKGHQGVALFASSTCDCDCTIPKHPVPKI